MAFRLIIPLLIGVMAGLTSLAHASPPDQTWIGGIYDNADYDDVVLLITGGLGGVPPNLVWSPCVRTLIVGFMPPNDTPLHASTEIASGPSRAPPLA